MILALNVDRFISGKDRGFLDIGFGITIPSGNIIKFLKVMYQALKMFREISEQRGKGQN